MKVTQARLAYWNSLRGKSHGHKTNNDKHWKMPQEIKDKMRAIALADGRRPDFTGRKHSLESRNKMSISAKSNPSRYWLGKDRTFIFTAEYRRNMSKIIKRIVDSGKHNFWKGGVTKKNKLERTRLEYKLFRETVFKRDDFRCLDCGVRGVQLEVHHIYPFSLYPRLRYTSENGVTLCKNCHKKTATYGRKALRFDKTNLFVTV